MRKNLVRNGFIAAGVMNIGGVLLFSRAFTNNAITEADPIVMSNFGLLMIAVWGLAYVGAAMASTGIKWLAGAFAIEKVVYVGAWLLWHSNNNLMALYSKDVFAGIFFSIYGLNDLGFMLFFAWVFFSASAEELETR
ncbi:MAG: hypothetical protein Q8M77_03130 [Hydrogenophaga sp.]|nr:hypothetical protein [Hydrogenophaga sp.]